MDSFTERDMRWAIDFLRLNNAVLEAALVALVGAADAETKARVRSAMEAAADGWEAKLTVGTVDEPEAARAKSIAAGAVMEAIDRASRRASAPHSAS